VRASASTVTSIELRKIDQHSTIAQRGCDPAVSTGAHRDAQSARSRELYCLDHLLIRRDRNDDLWEAIRNALLPDHPTPRRLILGVGPSDCAHFAALVRMSVLLVLPGFASLQGKFAFEIRKAFDGFPVFPREFEIDVLKLVVKADLAGIR
jgi:hypothetical protein